jgi:hypothetical protein
MSAYNQNVRAVLGAPLFSSLALQGWWEHAELFLQLPAANASIGVATNLNWELAGALAAAAFAPSGGITLTTNAVNGAEAIVFPHADTNQTAIAAIQWLTTNDVLFDVVVRPTLIAAQALYAGFKLTAALDLTTDANAVFFVYDPANSPNWQVATSIAGVDALTDTGVPAVADTDVRLTLIGGFTDDNGAAIVKAYIDGQFVGDIVGPTTGNLLPFVGNEGNAQSCIVRGLRVGKGWAA